MKALIFFVFFLSPLLHAEITPGSVAPNFKLLNAKGTGVKLADFRGKWIVLEWFNKDCPFVRKHYDSYNMQRLQKKFSAKNVEWFTILSSAPDKQGHESGAEALKTSSRLGAHPTQILLDPSGEVGHLYEAKVTPTIVIIDPVGEVRYSGAIDDTPSFDKSDIPKSRNYAELALDAGLSAKPISNKFFKAYGCSIKYSK